MKLIGEKLYLEMKEMEACGFKEKTIWMAKHRNSNSWDIINHPDDGRKVLVGYDIMRPDQKKKVQERYGDNPYDYVAKQPIREMVKYDEKAEQWFLNYRYCAGDKEKALSDDHVKKYAWAASWLNMLKEALSDKRSLKKALKLSIDEFYTQVIVITLNHQ